MNARDDTGSEAFPVQGRRAFIRRAAAGATVLLSAHGGTAATTAAPASPVAPGESAGDAAWDGIYRCLSAEEATFIEALVDHMCPPDDLTPGGVDCGLAVFIDGQLAGAFGQGDRLYLRGPFRAGLAEDGYQTPLTPAQFFKAGVREVDEGCRQRFGTGFARLAPSARETALAAIADGRWDAEGRLSLAAWFTELLYPLFVQACFADPIHGGNRDKVFWRMLGYPGLPAVYARDMISYRGRPYPGAQMPKSMQDFA